jgi:hypothetical protein
MGGSYFMLFLEIWEGAYPVGVGGKPVVCAGRIVLE